MAVPPSALPGNGAFLSYSGQSFPQAGCRHCSAPPTLAIHSNVTGQSRPKLAGLPRRPALMALEEWSQCLTGPHHFISWETGKLHNNKQHGRNKMNTLASQSSAPNNTMANNVLRLECGKATKKYINNSKQTNFTHTHSVERSPAWC